MGLFSRKSDVEKRLESHFADLIAASGGPPADARTMARDLLAKAKADANATLRSRVDFFKSLALGVAALLAAAQGMKKAFG